MALGWLKMSLKRRHPKMKATAEAAEEAEAAPWCASTRRQACTESSGISADLGLGQRQRPEGPNGPKESPANTCPLHRRILHLNPAHHGS